MNISLLTREDIPSLERIEKQSFSTPWGEKFFLEELENKNSVFFIARSGREVIGYAGMSNILGEGFISRVAVDESARKRGVATALFEALDDYAFKNNMSYITLEVRAGNSAAISLYEKSGYKRFGLRKRFYTNPVEDALIYTKYYTEGSKYENIGN